MKVARHEMPGHVANTHPSRRARCDRVAPGGFTVQGDTMPSLTHHAVPYGTGFAGAAFPGISCLATFMQSLRDKQLIMPERFFLTDAQSPLTNHLSPITFHQSLPNGAS